MMKIASTAALFTAAVFSVSCDKQETAAPDVKPAIIQPASNGSWKDSQFTSWMSRASLQILQENNPADQYFARVEGRDNGGLMEYRAVVKPFPSDGYDQWAVFWGIDDKELFEWELKLMRSGFLRDNMQIFADANGDIYHQIVWLKPATHTAEPTDQSVSVTSEQVISESVPRPRPPVAADESQQAERMPERAERVVQAPPPAVVIPETAPEPAPAPETMPVPPPKPEKAPVVDAEPAAPKAEEVKPSKKVTYSVKPGDTLGKIAKSKGVSVTDLKTANNLKTDIVRIGQKLVIPVK